METSASFEARSAPSSYPTIALGAAVGLWPVAVHTQQRMIPVTPGATASFLARFRQGLVETEFVEGRDLAIEYRWAENHFERLSALAADLCRKPQSSRR